MEAPYDTDVAADILAEARTTFNCLIGQLTDPVTGTALARPDTGRPHPARVLNVYFHASYGDEVAIVKT
ncbi:hypothetical protein J2853_005209 [Streptosporangium lutulentum]|uniref:Uncharacterized protein n=1 Tax=Streptosporangium lutulentum TaxID=1461250 RepID=A0ABT9QGV6_9ACTN|nr:hypothetical protein [Streptosporangium lutulentum]